MNHRWACLGDFKAYGTFEDKYSGAPPNYNSMDCFNSCVRDCGLLDLGYNGTKHLD